MPERFRSLSLRARLGRPQSRHARGLGVAAAAAVVAASLTIGPALADRSLHVTAVGAQPRVAGNATPTIISPELIRSIVAQGSSPLENQSADLVIAYYGYLADGAAMLPTNLASPTEAQKTEPDKNTYLVLKHQHGADSSYAYGTHFLFQGHELGPRGYITRINLDADPAHRVTLLASTQQATANLPAGNLPVIDGSVWDPFTKTLLFSSEGNGTSTGGIWEASPDVNSTVVDLLGVLGRGGYEGMQLDDDGNIWIVEDIGGKLGTAGAGLTTNNSKQPNSFIYRFVPTDKHDLSAGGKLEVLQADGLDGHPVTFTGGANPTQAQIDADATSAFMHDLHTYGNSFRTRWITVHDTAIDGTGTFNANLAAKTAGGTPFKRPENGQFRPTSGFTEFLFTETGDTSASSGANGPSGSSFGGWGGLLRLTQADPSAGRGTLRPFFLGDIAHTGLDNITYLDKNDVIAVEDAGDGLHASRNALDSAYLFPYGRNGQAAVPIRFIGQGRDPSATLDAGNAGFGKNEGDNELTGIHLSDGDPSVRGLIGTSNPDFDRGSHDSSDVWRFFYTQQHGDNPTYEIFANPN